MKKLGKIILMTMMSVSALAFVAYAEEETTEFAMYMLDDDERGSEEYVEDYDSEPQIKMTADVPSDFNMKIDVYFNDIPMGLYYNEDSEKSYNSTVPLPEGVYDVRVMSKADFVDEFSYTVEPKIIDTSKDSEIKIKVTPTENHNISEGDDDMGSYYSGNIQELESSEDGVNSENKVVPELIDLSDGKPYGTFHISLIKNIPALKSVTYSVSDGEHVYPIELKRDYVFCADVLLPVGEYHELKDIDFVLDDDVTMDEEIKCTWSHAYNRGFFGNYYDISENGENMVEDLEIMMVFRGDVFPFSSQMLYAQTLRERKNEAIESHAQAIMESTEAETTEEATTEVAIAELDKTDNKSDLMGYLPYVILLLVCIGTLSVVILKKTKKQ